MPVCHNITIIGKLPERKISGTRLLKTTDLDPATSKCFNPSAELYRDASYSKMHDYFKSKPDTAECQVIFFEINFPVLDAINTEVLRCIQETFYHSERAPDKLPILVAFTSNRLNLCKELLKSRWAPPSSKIIFSFQDHDLSEEYKTFITSRHSDLSEELQALQDQIAIGKQPLACMKLCVKALASNSPSIRSTASTEAAAGAGAGHHPEDAHDRHTRLKFTMNCGAKSAKVEKPEAKDEAPATSRCPTP